MKHFIFTLLIALIALTSCAESKEMRNPATGKVETIEPYGWANMDECKRDDVVYTIRPKTVVFSILGCETIVIPVVVTGWYLYEPKHFKDVK